MNRVELSHISYPPAPKGWVGEGFYYEIKPVATYESEMEFVEDLDAEARTKHPQANRIQVFESGTERCWTSGHITGGPLW